MKDKVNEIKVSYCEKLGVIDSPSLKSSAMVAQLLYENWNQDTIAMHESFKVLLLNNANKVKGTFQASSGGITGTVVDLRILFAVILKTLSTAIILAHNHPSGTLSPSEADRKLTERIKQAAGFFDVSVLDHIIIVPNGDFFSFADHHMI